MKYVIDSSVVVKWVVAEKDDAKARLIRDDFRNGTHQPIGTRRFHDGIGSCPYPHGTTGPAHSGRRPRSLDRCDGYFASTFSFRATLRASKKPVILVESSVQK